MMSLMVPIIHSFDLLQLDSTKVINDFLTAIVGETLLLVTSICNHVYVLAMLRGKGSGFYHETFRICGL